MLDRALPGECRIASTSLSRVWWCVKALLAKMAVGTVSLGGGL
jgi:hypothetical protein